jgi:hypothetical protein
MLCNSDTMQECGKYDYKYDYIYSHKGHLQLP